MPSRHTALLAATLVVSQVHAAERPGISFTHNDWEIACDNTRTCRAAGYQSDEVETGASVLLTRAAGPNTPIHADVEFAPAEEVPAIVQMHIDGKPLGSVSIKEGGGSLSDQQTAALLAAVLKNSKIVWTAKRQQWQLSTAGANAVLLKMDEFLGRLGTPGALVRKGSKPESAVLPALPAPELNAPRVTHGAANEKLVPMKQRAALLAELRKTVLVKGQSDCELLDEADAAEKLTFYELNAQKLVVSAECWHGAYNVGEAYWVSNRRPPYSPALVTTGGSGYGDGEITAYQKGRGVGDCGSSATWTWDGRSFVHTEEASTGQCKGFAGGAWSLPTLVVRVNKAK